MSITLPSYETCLPPAGFPDGWVAPSVGTMQNYRRSRGLGIVAAHEWEIGREAAPAQPENIPRAARRLRGVANAERKAGRRLAGLAATQLGIPLRMLLADLTPGIVTGELTCIINPVLLDSSETLATGSEGCFSCPGVAGMVERPEYLQVQYLDEQGEERVLEAKGTQARVLDHEIDHLDGFLVPERVLMQPDNNNRLLALPAEVLPQYREVTRDNPSDWPLEYPAEQWHAVRHGTLRMEDFALPELPRP